ncbi:MAG: endonuclease/exonuclease/phosphatase family protein [Pseudomonadota bacterium]
MKMTSLRRQLAVATSLSLAFGTASAGVWVNEFHYDNASTDVGEFFEFAGAAGTSIDGWSLVLYNGSSSVRAPYATINLSGTFTDQSNGFGFITEAFAGIQNGSPDGFALIDNSANVVEFLSYEGTFTAASGDAMGQTSTDIGVAESSSTPAGFSLQRVGSGSQASDFTWAAPAAETPGAVNTGQSFGAVSPPPPPPPPPPPAQEVAIYDIQGAGHRSAFEGEEVTTSGIVTGVTSNGFYVQDAMGDGDIATSDGIFIFTGGAPDVALADEVSITGDVSEFRRGSQSEGLTLTQIAFPADITVLSNDNALPDAIVMGGGGRIPPTESIDSDSFGTFNPSVDGIDYYESLEGMRVVLPDAQAVSTPNRFGEIYAVGDRGANATGMNAAGGITISEGDLNPERIQIQSSGGNSVAGTDVGDKIGDVTGFVSYSFSDYEIVVDNAVTVTEAANNVPEVTQLVGDRSTLTVATFNALLQDGFATPTQDQIDGIAAQIVNNMQSPDIIGLQEVQTDFANGGAQALIDAIVAAGGPQYELAFVDGNNGINTTSIQPAFLYSSRVTLDSVELMENGIPTDADDPFAGGQRVPLVGTFTFNGETFTIVNNHFDSKGGSSPLFGSTQPPNDGGLADRLAQAQLVNDFVDGFLAMDSEANILVLGDLNAFGFEEALRTVLAGADDVLTNLDFLVPDITERFTFNFEGNAQALDHIFANLNVLEGFDLALDFLHINSLFQNQASDHDPVLLALTVQPIPVPAAFWGMLAGIVALVRQARRAS